MPHPPSHHSTTGIWQKRVSKPSAATPETLATALCDAGLVHVNEPRVHINGVNFYPSDFWPERKTQLDKKITAAASSQHTAIVVHDPAHHMRWPGKSAYGFLVDLLTKAYENTPSEVSPKVEALARRFGNRILRHFREGTPYVFDADMSSREQDLWPSDRNYAIRFLARTPADQLEYLLRCGTEIHLNTRWEDDCGLAGPRPENKFWLGSMLDVHDRHLPGPRPHTYTSITVGGTEIRASSALHVLSHETAHVMFKNAIKMSPPSIMLTVWKATYKKLLDDFAALSDHDQKAFAAYSPPSIWTHGIGVQYQDPMGHLLFDQYNHYEAAKKLEEAFCNSFALRSHLDTSQPIVDMSVAASTTMQHHLAQIMLAAQDVLNEQLASLRLSAPPMSLPPASGHTR